MPDYLDLADRSWPLLRRLMGLHGAIYRVTGGRLGGRVPGMPPTMLLLEHTGARSGERRTTPLIYMRDGDHLVIVASKGGYPRNPAWLHNIRAHPGVEVQLGDERFAARAREAEGAERQRLWPALLAHYPPWGRYQERTERRIPVVVLEPAERKR